MAPAASLRLRASPSYELIPLERLPPSARRARAALAADPDAYGLLRPRARGRAARAVDRESALLLLTLREPGPLPAYLGRGRDAAGALAALRALVLDGVVEVAPPGGAFAAGPAALALLDRPAAAGPAAAGGRPAELSREALRAAAALPGGDAGALARRLYEYGRAPLTPAWARAVPDAAALRRWLGLAAGGPAARAVARRWREGPPGGPWLAFAPGAPLRSLGAKLYVSPARDDLPAALAALARALPRGAEVPFKVAATPAGALRADRLVAYFPSLDALRAAAARLEPLLAGLRPAGVPFSAPVTADGMLSWGVDPADRALGSWRAWLCARLAEHLVAARAAGVADPAAEAAARIAADGVSPDDWAPLPGARAARARRDGGVPPAARA